MVQDTVEPTLDEMRETLAPGIAAAAAFDGWTSEAVRHAAAEQDIDADVAAYAFKGGQMDMIAAWIAHVDREMERALGADRLSEMKIRERISQLIRFRLGVITGQEEALRRTLAIMAMPQNVSRALQLGWRSADRMWRLAGDSSTDFNHYTKRTTLAAIYAATLAIFVDDKSEGKAETLAFLTGGSMV